MKIVCVSDTHCRHAAVNVPDGDVLIFAGDACMSGSLAELVSFAEWLKVLPHKEKIVVAGNHDWCLERPATRRTAENVIAEAGAWYLCDYAVTITGGLKVYGSPWQPEFCDWAFNLPRGKPLVDVWEKIPDDTDILVTHGPPVGPLDGTGRGVDRVGDADLAARVKQLNRLKLHVFGHIHEGHGVDERNDVISVNAAVGYHLEGAPIVVDI
jgi:Icc-related predicted phosphoesterase